MTVKPRKGRYYYDSWIGDFITYTGKGRADYPYKVRFMNAETKINNVKLEYFETCAKIGESYTREQAREMSKVMGLKEKHE